LPKLGVPQGGDIGKSRENDNNDAATYYDFIKRLYNWLDEKKKQWEAIERSGVRVNQIF